MSQCIIQLVKAEKASVADTKAAGTILHMEWALGFVKSESPAGINLPNFEDICQNIGSKSLGFGNVNNANPTEEPLPFIQEHEVPFLRKLRERAFEVTVACHELLGHGSGQLHGTETWSSIFGSNANAIEECRADGVALILLTCKPILQIFGYTEESEPSADDLTYAGWLYFAYGTVKGVSTWDPATRGQFALLNCMVKAVPSFLQLKVTGDDLVIVMDRTKIISHALPAIENLMRHIQVYKSTANATAGVACFSEFSEVDETFADYRDIIVRKEPARIQYIQPNTFLESGHVRLQEYPATREGLTQSWVERRV
ncbi:MAG: hypothetical protein M1839_001290 [Geoglossum umbratile]|nr:MAG: hypothetical protein M1839_001290 [Geoglossum umbratile]